MADRLYTSQQADEFINGLRMESKLEKSILTRIALCISLIKNGPSVLVSNNFSGGELKRPTFFKDEEVFIKALINQVYQRSDFTDDEFYSNKSVIKNHIDDGAGILWALYESNGRDITRWFKELLTFVEFEHGRDPIGKELDIFIGRNILTREELFMEINDTGKTCQFPHGNYGKTWGG
jgi:DNA sulfur modification protein DndE